jgi:hypothetical protein
MSDKDKAIPLAGCEVLIRPIMGFGASSTHQCLPVTFKSISSIDGLDDSMIPHSSTCCITCKYMRHFGI